MNLGKFALDRGFFEQDQEFPTDQGRLVDAYNGAARRAASSAKYAVSSGKKSSMRQAQWNEAVCQTIEECLYLVINKDKDFDPPAQPQF